jgi:hypothetical protein
LSGPENTITPTRITNTARTARYRIVRDKARFFAPEAAGPPRSDGGATGWGAAALDGEDRFPEAHLIPGFQRGPFHPDPVDQHAVGAAPVRDHHHRTVHGDDRVVAGDALVILVQDQGVVRAAPDGHLAA